MYFWLNEIVGKYYWISNICLTDSLNWFVASVKPGSKWSQPTSSTSWFAYGGCWVVFTNAVNTNTLLQWIVKERGSAEGGKLKNLKVTSAQPCAVLPHKTD